MASSTGPPAGELDHYPIDNMSENYSPIEHMGEYMQIDSFEVGSMLSGKSTAIYISGTYPLNNADQLSSTPSIAPQPITTKKPKFSQRLKKCQQYHSASRNRTVTLRQEAIANIPPKPKFEIKLSEAGRKPKIVHKWTGRTLQISRNGHVKVLRTIPSKTRVSRFAVIGIPPEMWGAIVSHIDPITSHRIWTHLSQVKDISPLFGCFNDFVFLVRALKSQCIPPPPPGMPHLRYRALLGGSGCEVEGCPRKLTRKAYWVHGERLCRDCLASRSYNVSSTTENSRYYKIANIFKSNQLRAELSRHPIPPGYLLHFHEHIPYALEYSQSYP